MIVEKGTHMNLTAMIYLAVVVVMVRIVTRWETKHQKQMKPH